MATPLTRSIYDPLIAQTRSLFSERARYANELAPVVGRASIGQPTIGGIYDPNRLRMLINERNIATRESWRFNQGQAYLRTRLNNLLSRRAEFARRERASILGAQHEERIDANTAARLQAALTRGRGH